MSAPRYTVAVALDGHRVATLRGLSPRDAIRLREGARAGFRRDGAEVSERCRDGRWRRVM